MELEVQRPLTEAGCYGERERLPRGQDPFRGKFNHGVVASTTTTMLPYARGFVASTTTAALPHARAGNVKYPFGCEKENATARLRIRMFSIGRWVGYVCLPDSLY